MIAKNNKVIEHYSHAEFEKIENNEEYREN